MDDCEYYSKIDDDCHCAGLAQELRLTPLHERGYVAAACEQLLRERGWYRNRGADCPIRKRGECNCPKYPKR